jgi:hypothetical protein
MKSLIFTSALALASLAQADTIDNYMNISSNIPQMELKADQQAQTWARSARNVLLITSESIAETLVQANELAKNQGSPLFCLPQDSPLDAEMLNSIIVQTYKDISSQQSDKDKMTVSQVAWLGVQKKYPCQHKENGAANAAPEAQKNTSQALFNTKTTPMQQIQSLLGSP